MSSLRFIRFSVDEAQDCLHIQADVILDVLKRKGNGKPWVLPKCLMVVLDNMSKQPKKPAKPAAASGSSHQAGPAKTEVEGTPLRAQAVQPEAATGTAEVKGTTPCGPAKRRRN